VAPFWIGGRSGLLSIQRRIPGFAVRGFDFRQTERIPE